MDPQGLSATFASTLTLVGGAIVIVAIVIQTRGAPPSEPDDERALPAPH